MSEQEDNVRSNLPYPVKLIGTLLVIGFVCVPPLWACIEARSLLGIFISLALADIVAKIVWRFC